MARETPGVSLKIRGIQSACRRGELRPPNRTTPWGSTLPKGPLGSGAGMDHFLAYAEIRRRLPLPPSRLAERYEGSEGLSSGLQSARVRIPLTCMEDQEAFCGPVSGTDSKERCRAYVGWSFSRQSRLLLNWQDGGTDPQWSEPSDPEKAKRDVGK